MALERTSETESEDELFYEQIKTDKSTTSQTEIGSTTDSQDSSTTRNFINTGKTKTDGDSKTSGTKVSEGTSDRDLRSTTKSSRTASTRVSIGFDIAFIVPFDSAGVFPTSENC